MSLLEDIFLQDEAGEAQELERIIEGDEFEERRRSDSENDSEKDDEAVEDKRRVDPAQAKPKRVVKNPRVILNPARLTGPRGIQVIPEHFKDFKFKGKGHEKEDLDLVLKKLEHWAYRLFPKFQFDDCLKKIETLGKKRPVMVHLQKIRSDQYQSDEIVVQKDSSDDETPQAAADEVEDEFDKLLGEQIELARAKVDTPGSNMKGFKTPSTADKRISSMMPKAISSPSISEEQRERMLLNRKLAEERRLARLKKNKTVTVENGIRDIPNDNTIDENLPHNNENEETTARRHNKPNVINSDDEETENDIIVNGRSEVIDNDVTEKQIKTSDDKEIENNVTIISASYETDNDVSRKQKRANVIDSSDEEFAGDSVIAVDIHEETNKITRPSDKGFVDQIDLNNAGKHSKSISEESNITIDLVNQTNKIIDSNEVIDITEHEHKNPVTGPTHIVDTVDLSNIEENAENNEITRRTNNRSAVTDSSDDECEITSTNNDVTVELHKNVDIKSNNEDHTAAKDTVEGPKIDENIQQIEEEIIKDHYKHDSNDKEMDIEIQDLDLENSEAKSSKTDAFDDMLNEINTNEDKIEKFSASGVNNIGSNNESNTLQENSSDKTCNLVSDTENLEATDKVDIEELMDVDFSEDF